jgi:hypothetical protein
MLCEPGLRSQGARGPPHPLGPTTPEGADLRSIVIGFARDRMEVTHGRPPWLTGRAHPRCKLLDGLGDTVLLMERAVSKGTDVKTVRKLLYRKVSLITRYQYKKPPPDRDREAVRPRPRRFRALGALHRQTATGSVACLRGRAGRATAEHGGGVCLSASTGPAAAAVRAAERRAKAHGVGRICWI